MANHPPATFNMTYYDPAAYHGVAGTPGTHLLPNPGVPQPSGFPNQYLDSQYASEDFNFESYRVVPSELQGPLAMRNDTMGSTIVSPLLAIPVNNHTYVQLPILWTALSLALGLEIQGQINRGLPCIKRLNQLFCRTPGNNYPRERIAQFIDENKALMRRMYGEYDPPPQEIFAEQHVIRTGRSTDEESADRHPRGGSFMNLINNRARRQTSPGTTPNSSDKMDACESTVDIQSPYWATNSASKVRAIVNTEGFEQPIHQEICTKQSTKRCGGECSCEQKYKYHRLLAYDPEDDCRGIFMDWFLFPSCCVCRCNPP
ncbi:protein spaetzle 3-like isoform X2 [Oratosquilla oratoria]|uniref:protein spaetzle 3-like isoform X2 n=1 Tax=Oratosquilla oratoria TaxID=337810 RepID=UPI003F76B825